MTYGVKCFKNGRKVGYLFFDTGKRVYLNSKEENEFAEKLRWAEYTGKLKSEAEKARG